MNPDNAVVSDSSFYIAFLSPKEINYPQALKELLQEYNFIIGEVVLNEISKKHKPDMDFINFGKYVKVLERYDYASLLSIIGYKIFEEGEYESIAIAYLFYKKFALHSLILDDNDARDWVKINIPELHQFLKYSLRILVDSYCIEGKRSREKIVDILERVKQAIKNGNRPFNLVEKNMDIIEKLLKEVEGCQK